MTGVGTMRSPQYPKSSPKVQSEDTKKKKGSAGVDIVEMIVGICVFLIGYLIFRCGRKLFQKIWK